MTVHQAVPIAPFKPREVRPFTVPVERLPHAPHVDGFPVDRRQHHIGGVGAPFGLGLFRLGDTSLSSFSGLSFPGLLCFRNRNPYCRHGLLRLFNCNPFLVDRQLFLVIDQDRAGDLFH